MSTVVFRLKILCPLIITIPIVGGCSHEEEGEDIVVEGLFQILIEDEEYHEEGSVVEVEGLLLLLKSCREGDCVLDLAICM